MTMHLQICCRGGGDWSVDGLSAQLATHLPSLAASIDYARRQSGAAPATIELVVDGFYAVIHQAQGWPRQLVYPDAGVREPIAQYHDSGGHRAIMRLRHWFTGGN